MARDVPLLEKLAEWIMDGSPDCLSLVKESNCGYYFHFSYPANIFLTLFSYNAEAVLP